MADFCKQCWYTFLQEDDRTDFDDIANGRTLEPGFGYPVICEGCGFTTVDEQGRCNAPDCLEKGHPGNPYNPPA